MEFLYFITLFCVITITKADLHIHHEKAEVTSFNKDFLTEISVTVNRINESLSSLSSKMTMVQDFVDCTMTMDFEKMDGNEYKPFNYSLDLPCCEFFSDSSLNIYKSHLSDGIHSNMPTKCPDETTFPKGDYFVDNAMVDESFDIEIFQPGEWRVLFGMNSKNVNMYTLYYYYKVSVK